MDDDGVITADKTVIFNCNVAHSKKVLDVFTRKGYPCRHLDGKTPKSERKEILKWLKNTPDAVLMNVGVLTAGFDEPSIQTIIINRSTLSVTLWIQMTGRGSRTYPNKKNFKILDLGGNALRHGDWSDDRDWVDIFHNPPKPSKKEGVAPVKECVNEDCRILIPAQARICKHCGTKQPIKEKKDDLQDVELVLFNGKTVDVEKAINETKENGYKDYATLHTIKRDIVKNCRKQKMTVELKNQLHDIYQKKVEQWCKEVGKKYNRWHKETTRKWMNDAIRKKWIDGKKSPKKKAEIEAEALENLNEIFKPENMFEI